MVGGGSEADAIVNQILVRNEILKEACIDIFEEGNEYDFMKNDFVSFYNEGINKRDMKIAKKKIAEIYVKQKTSTSNPPQTYEDSYGDYCKKYVRYLLLYVGNYFIFISFLCTNFCSINAFIQRGCARWDFKAISYFIL